MDLSDRLNAIGMSKADFARALGVSAAAVSQWKEIPAHAEAKLLQLEGGGPSRIAPGNLVRQGSETFRVIRRDHCESWKGEETWIYWISPAVQVSGGWHVTGGATRSPEWMLADLGPQTWVEKVENKGKLTDESDGR